MKWIVTVVAAGLLVACSSTPTSPASGPTPAQIVASGEARGLVHWGGQIVQVKNLRDRTLIEVLALPLDGKGRPQVDKQPQGRFIVDKPGFLEPHEYAPYRLLEVHGQLSGFTEGQVGDAPFRYPVVIGATLDLWPAAQGTPGWSRQPRINFGVGVSNHGGGVGVGVGF